MYRAVGAVGTYRTAPHPSTHNLGTCRMSERPEDGVVDNWGRAHEVPDLFVSDGSQFTSGAAADPTLTIVSLVNQQAEHLTEALRTGEI
ncbi:MAG TPA: GMC family oxidoreductase [Candidatus Brachybacterium merdavium]|uniref:GMC family oxidoreductase n=1 Tax=Candidatus Brachybacterium merdavium TaxID=2838513 RepID=A0A9D2LAV2_9MICO|nr:GMC family oxidoreductase [Candidatus Brachybacterium merdavium]